MQEKPNYYAIIPATVRYDEKLKANEIITKEINYPGLDVFRLFPYAIDRGWDYSVRLF